MIHTNLGICQRKADSGEADRYAFCGSGVKGALFATEAPQGCKYCLSLVCIGYG
jgi:hypothetical protein